jgi:hypothetical protein
MKLQLRRQRSCANRTLEHPDDAIHNQTDNGSLTAGSDRAVSEERKSVGIGCELGVTPSVALAYAVVVIGFLTAEKFSANAGTRFSHAEIPLATPAE